MWTAPFMKGLIWVDEKLFRVRSCVRSVDAVHLTAGPAVRPDVCGRPFRCKPFLWSGSLM